MKQISLKDYRLLLSIGCTTGLLIGDIFLETFESDFTGYKVDRNAIYQVILQQLNIDTKSWKYTTDLKGYLLLEASK